MAAVRVQEPHQEGGDRALARARRAHQRHTPAGLEPEVDALESPPLAVALVEGRVLEAHGGSGGQWKRMDRLGDRRGLVREHEQPPAGLQRLVEGSSRGRERRDRFE